MLLRNVRLPTPEIGADYSHRGLNCNVAGLRQEWSRAGPYRDETAPR
jgi:hypothetical protein